MDVALIWVNYGKNPSPPLSLSVIVLLLFCVSISVSLLLVYKESPVLSVCVCAFGLRNNKHYNLECQYILMIQFSFEKHAK